MRYYVSLILMLASGMTIAQPNANFGVFAGTAYYMGDINPSRHFYRPKISYGAIFRYNINTRYAVRTSAYVADLSGSDLDFPERLHPDRPYSPSTFSTSLLDLALQLEFNFLPYMPTVGKWAYTPYISAGIAGGLVMGSTENAQNHMSLPLGIGMKVNLTSRLSVGAEWSFRKAFYDGVDGLKNPSGENSPIHNNDWYSFAGIFITFKFFNFVADCPAYN